MGSNRGIRREGRNSLDPQRPLSTQFRKSNVHVLRAGSGDRPANGIHRRSYIRPAVNGPSIANAFQKLSNGHRSPRLRDARNANTTLRAMVRSTGCDWAAFASSSNAANDRRINQSSGMWIMASAEMPKLASSWPKAPRRRQSKLRDQG